MRRRLFAGAMAIIFWICRLIWDFAGGFQAGLKYAARYGYRYAVQLDGDGQHRPEYIAAMKEKMDEGYEIVIGSRFVGQKKPFTMRMLGSNLIEKAIRMTTGVDIKIRPPE